VVIGAGADRHALSEDYLTLQLRDPRPPRGERFTARVARDGERLVAERRSA
jgi:hypothetical protein